MRRTYELNVSSEEALVMLEKSGVIREFENRWASVLGKPAIGRVEAVAEEGRGTVSLYIVPETVSGSLRRPEVGLTLELVDTERGCVFHYLPNKVVGSALEIRYGLIGSLLLTAPVWWLDWRYAVAPGVLLPLIALIAWLANQRWIRVARRSLVDVVYRAWSPVLSAPEASGYRALEPASAR